MGIVDFCFGLINSALVFGLFAYAFRTWILPAIRCEIANEKNHRLEQMTSQTRLSSLLLSLDKERELRDDSYRNLMGKVAAWAQFHEEQALQERTFFSRNELMYQKRLEQQQMYLLMHAIERKTLSKAVEKAESELQGNFESLQRGSRFVEIAIDSLLGDAHV